MDVVFRESRCLGMVGFLSNVALLFDVDIGGLTSILFMIALLSAFGFMVILGVRLVARETRERLSCGLDDAVLIAE